MDSSLVGVILRELRVLYLGYGSFYIYILRRGPNRRVGIKVSSMKFTVVHATNTPSKENIFHPLSQIDTPRHNGICP
jgi:hypothetical protein